MPESTSGQLLQVGDVIVFHTPKLRARFGERAEVTHVTGRWAWCGTWGFTAQRLSDLLDSGAVALVCPRRAPADPDGANQSQEPAPVRRRDDHSEGL